MFRRKPKKVVIPIVTRRRFGAPNPRPPLRITPAEWYIGALLCAVTFFCTWVFVGGPTPSWSPPVDEVPRGLYLAPPMLLLFFGRQVLLRRQPQQSDRDDERVW